MVLDMETEFYKLAKSITGNPKNFHKLLAITPATGRMSMMGADGGVIVSSGMLSSIVKNYPEKAYAFGRRSSKDIFGALIDEFDEEVLALPAGKKMELGLGLARATGWGMSKVLSYSERRREMTIVVSDPIESGFETDGGYKLTAGFLAGLATVAFRTAMVCGYEGPSGDGQAFLLTQRTG